MDTSGTNVRPRVSILIPNFNNGRQSSTNGQIDLIGNLLQSLWDTLQDDPTPFEIIVYDDGSTDDSLQTLRQWASRTWPKTSGGRATEGGRLLKLIEGEHCGILAVTANIMSRQARGEYFARLDGDTVCLTPRWVSRLCKVFDTGPPRLGVVGPKQIGLDGRIHAFGDWLLHPNGYTHVAAGAERYAVQAPMEVDHVMGCFYCHRREVFEELEGYDEAFLRGQTIDFGLRARLAGWSCIAVPHIEFVHAHGHRGARQTTADSGEGVHQALETFRRKWGFCRLAPDMDEIRRRYAGTPLLWNARYFGTPADGWPEAEPVQQPIRIERSDWVRYTKDAAFKRTMDLRVGLAADVAKQVTEPGMSTVGLVGAGHGLLAHLLAGQAMRVVASEREQAWVKFAQTCVANQQYPNGGGKPEYLHQSDPRQLPFDDGQCDLLLLFDQLDRHPNPVALLREAHRVVRVDGTVVLVVRRGSSDLQPTFDASHPYTLQQLVTQVQATGGWGLLSDPSKDTGQGEMVMVVKRLATLPVPVQGGAATIRATDPPSQRLAWTVRQAHKSDAHKVLGKELHARAAAEQAAAAV